MNQLLTEHLQPAVFRVRARRLGLFLAIVWSVLAVMLGMLIVANQFGGWNPPPSTRYVVLFAGAACILVGLISGLVVVWRKRDDYSRVAALLERRFPKLDSRLLTAIEQRPQPMTGQFGFLQQEVIRQAIYHDFEQPWKGLVPSWQLAASMSASILSFVSATGVMVLIVLGLKVSHRPTEIPFYQAAIDAKSYSCKVEPGNVELEKGTSLLVLARFNDAVPPDALLKFRSANGEVQVRKMDRSLNDPLFAARVAEVSEPLWYCVEYESNVTEEYQVTLFEFPELRRVNATLNFPEYTRLSAVKLEDVRKISAVQGTRAELAFQLNKPVVRAELVSETGDIISLYENPLVAAEYLTQINLEKSGRYDVVLRDDQDRVNRFPPRLTITVLPNQLPKVAIKSPSRDVQVSPLEEVNLRAEFWDDFGLSKVGLTLAIPDREPIEIVLGESLPAKTSTVKDYLLALEDLNVLPDDLISYFVWAEDIAPDGALRRTHSDMFFAEIRPFDQIYRQGQQPTAEQMRQQQQQQSGSQNAQQAEQLAETQKQIINATWNIIRREGGANMSPPFGNDVKLISASQAQARQQTEEIAGQVKDQRSLIFVSEVKRQMDKALTELDNASNQLKLSPLHEALQAEQAAYQGLLRLRAREHEVVRMNQQAPSPSSASQQNNAQQQQMQQLDLQKESNPYEQEIMAPNQESPEARENRQVLNRLRELARRQEDLNERIQEVQSEIQKAETPDEKTELERQLKRLREEQQQILRDTDELRDRMQSEQNQSQMAEQSKQLDQAREEIRQSSDALANGQASRAAANGNRAKEQLDELKDEFQRRASSQFSEAMQQMRSRAQDLAQRQEQLTEQLENLEQPTTKQPSLRQENDREKAVKELESQKKRLEELRQSMRDTVEKAEDVEPLLAEALYDTYRNAEQQQPEQSLDSAARSLARGFDNDAQMENLRAAESIDAIRDGVERAASNVLGDEAESLRRAKQELDRLSDEVQKEFDEKAPDAIRREASSERQQGGQVVTDQSNSDSRSSDKAGPPNQKGEQSPPAVESQPSDQKGLAGSQLQEPTNQPLSGNGRNQNGRNADLDKADGLPPNLQDDPDRVGNPNITMLRSNESEGEMPTPLSGEDFRGWSDRLRDVEEMIGDEELRAEASRIRNRALELRKDMHDRHSAEPNWELVQLKIMQPLQELKNRVAEELLKKTSNRPTVPIDRDPVPTQFENAVQQYYRELGVGK